jgi:hypothetical protein
MSADIKREGVSNMNKKLNLLVMLVCLLALSLVFGSCDNGTTTDMRTYTLKVVNQHDSAYISEIRLFNGVVGATPVWTTLLTESQRIAPGSEKSFSIQINGEYNNLVDKIEIDGSQEDGSSPGTINWAGFDVVSWLNDGDILIVTVDPYLDIDVDVVYV